MVSSGFTSQTTNSYGGNWNEIKTFLKGFKFGLSCFLLERNRWLPWCLRVVARMKYVFEVVMEVVLLQEEDE